MIGSGYLNRERAMKQIQKKHTILRWVEIVLGIILFILGFLYLQPLASRMWFGE